MQISYRAGTLIMLAALVPVVAATAVGGLITGRNQTDICGPHIRAAEVANGIPRGLLRSIALAESGGYNKVKGANAAWPWTLNNAGRGFYFRSKPAAVRKVMALRRAGKTNIDVGCMQVNLYYHGRHFPTINAALDPATNTAYAGKLLRSLFRRTGNWRAAVGRYHSATPWRSKRYAGKVYRFWSRSGGGTAVASVKRTRGSTAALRTGGLDRQTRISGGSALQVAMNFAANMIAIPQPAAKPPVTPKATYTFSAEVARTRAKPGTTKQYSVTTSGLAAGGAYTGSTTRVVTPQSTRAGSASPNAAFAEFLMTGKGAKPAAKRTVQPKPRHVPRTITKRTKTTPIQALRRQQPTYTKRMPANIAGKAPKMRQPNAAAQAQTLANSLSGNMGGASPSTLGLPPSRHVSGVLTANTGLMPGLTPNRTARPNLAGARPRPSGSKGAAYLRSQSSLGYRPSAARPQAFGSGGAKRLKLYRQNGAAPKTYKFTRKKK